MVTPELMNSYRKCKEALEDLNKVLDQIALYYLLVDAGWIRSNDDA